MSKFEEIIKKIDNEISINQEDREVYTKDFDLIRNYLLSIMQEEDAVFKQIYAGPSLFGSFAENIRINKPDEFDVHFLLKLPYYKHIQLKRDNNRPGFVKICLAKVMAHMKKDPNHQLVYNTFKNFLNDRDYLCRNMIQHWLCLIIKRGLNKNGNTIKSSTGDEYKLIYLTRGTAHTLKASSTRTHRKISIDFVPAFKFDAKNEWLADRKFPKEVKEKLWFAVPKPTVGLHKGRYLTFSICVPQIEKHLLLNRYNLKCSLRLFKSLRDRLGEDRLKSYFIKSLYLHENDRQDEEFWRQPTGKILIHMIGRLLECLEQQRIPFYWSQAMNLLGLLEERDILSLKKKFKKIKSLLEEYAHQPQITYSTVRHLFGYSSKPLKKEFA